MLISVRVHPGAAREAIAVRAEGTLEIWVRKPAADGQANQAVLRGLAERLGVPPSAVLLRRGAASRIKQVEVPLATWAELVARVDSGPG